MRRKYPIRLLPSKTYKELGRLSSVLNSDYVLIRTAPDNKPISSYDNLLFRLSELMKASQFRKGGVSMSLLGRYKKKDNCIIVNYKADNRYSEYWHQGDSCKRPKRKNIRYRRDRGYFGIPIKAIEAVSKMSKLKKDGANIGMHKITMQVIHKPTLSNYWHCEIVLYGELIPDKPNIQPYNKPLLEITSKTVTENIGGELLEMLKQDMLLPQVMKDVLIPKSVFC